MTYATPEDVAKELRGSTSVTAAEAVQWQAWLDRVERAIRRGFTRAGLDLSNQISLGDPTADDAKDVEVAVVIRKIQNPKWGETSSTVSVDDGSVTRRREGGDGGDPLELLAGDWSQLLPGASATGWSTRPGFEPDRVAPEQWV